MSSGSAKGMTPEEIEDEKMSDDQQKQIDHVSEQIEDEQLSEQVLDEEVVDEPVDDAQIDGKEQSIADEELSNEKVEDEPVEEVQQQLQVDESKDKVSYRDENDKISSEKEQVKDNIDKQSMGKSIQQSKSITYEEPTEDDQQNKNQTADVARQEQSQEADPTYEEEELEEPVADDASNLSAQWKRATHSDIMKGLASKTPVSATVTDKNVTPNEQQAPSRDTAQVSASGPIDESLTPQDDNHSQKKKQQQLAVHQDEEQGQDDGYTPAQSKQIQQWSADNSHETSNIVSKQRQSMTASKDMSRVKKNSMANGQDEVIEKDVSGAPSKSAGGDAEQAQAEIELDQILDKDDDHIQETPLGSSKPLKSIMSEKRNSALARTHDSIKQNRQVQFEKKNAVVNPAMNKTANAFSTEVKSQAVGAGLNEDLQHASPAASAVQVAADAVDLDQPLNQKSTTPKPARGSLTIKASYRERAIEEYVSPRRRPDGERTPLIERPKSIQTIAKPDSTDNGRYHSRKEMVARAKAVLQNITYDRRDGVGGIFDDKEYDQGWLYLYTQIFQLPRSERFVAVLQERLRLAATITARRKHDEQVVRKKPTRKLLVKDINGDGKNSDRAINGIDKNLTDQSSVKASELTYTADKADDQSSISPRRNQQMLPEERAKLRHKFRPSAIDLRVDDTRSPAPGKGNLKKSSKRIPHEELLYYPASQVPSFIRQSPKWQRINGLDSELAQITNENTRFDDYIRKVKKLIEEIDRQHAAEEEEVAEADPSRDKRASPARPLMHHVDSQGKGGLRTMASTISQQKVLLKSPRDSSMHVSTVDQLTTKHSGFNAAVTRRLSGDTGDDNFALQGRNKLNQSSACAFPTHEKLAYQGINQMSGDKRQMTIVSPHDSASLDDQDEAERDAGKRAAGLYDTQPMQRQGSLPQRTSCGPGISNSNIYASMTTIVRKPASHAYRDLLAQQKDDVQKRIRQIEQRLDGYDGKNSLRTTQEDSSMMFMGSAAERPQLGLASQSQMQQLSGPSGALQLGSGDVEPIRSPPDTSRKVGSFREHLMAHAAQKKHDALRERDDGDDDFDHEPTALQPDATSRNAGPSAFGAQPRHSVPTLARDLDGSLAVKKRLRKHLIVQGYYNEKPNYKALASQLVGKSKRSAVGLLDKNKQIVRKYENDDICGTSKFSPRIKKAARIAPLDDAITTLTLQKIQNIAERATPRRAELAGSILVALKANNSVTPQQSTSKFMHNASNFFNPSPPVVASPFLHQPSGPALDSASGDLHPRHDRPSAYLSANRGMQTSNETFGEVFEDGPAPYEKPIDGFYFNKNSGELNIKSGTNLHFAKANMKKTKRLSLVPSQRQHWPMRRHPSIAPAQAAASPPPRRAFKSRHKSIQVTGAPVAHLPSNSSITPSQLRALEIGYTPVPTRWPLDATAGGAASKNIFLQKRLSKLSSLKNGRVDDTPGISAITPAHGSARQSATENSLNAAVQRQERLNADDPPTYDGSPDERGHGEPTGKLTTTQYDGGSMLPTTPLYVGAQTTKSLQGRGLAAGFKTQMRRSSKKKDAVPFASRTGINFGLKLNRDLSQHEQQPSAAQTTRHNRGGDAVKLPQLQNGRGSRMEGHAATLQPSKGGNTSRGRGKGNKKPGNSIFNRVGMFTTGRNDSTDAMLVATSQDPDGKLRITKKSVQGTKEEIDGLAEMVQKGRTSNHTGRSADMQSYVDSVEERYHSKGSTTSHRTRSLRASQSPRSHRKRTLTRPEPQPEVNVVRQIVTKIDSNMQSGGDARSETALDLTQVVEEPSLKKKVTTQDSQPQIGDAAAVRAGVHDSERLSLAYVPDREGSQPQLGLATYGSEPGVIVPEKSNSNAQIFSKELFDEFDSNRKRSLRLGETQKYQLTQQKHATSRKENNMRKQLDIAPQRSGVPTVTQKLEPDDLFQRGMSQTIGSPSQVTLQQAQMPVQNFYETDKSIAPPSTVKNVKALKNIKVKHD